MDKKSNQHQHQSLKDFVDESFKKRAKRAGSSLAKHAGGAAKKGLLGVGSFLKKTWTNKSHMGDK